MLGASNTAAAYQLDDAAVLCLGLPLWEQLLHQLLACLQVIGHHTDFLRRVLKGCLLSRKLTLLQSLVQLKKQAATFTQLTAALHIDTDALADSITDLDIVPKGGSCHIAQTAYNSLACTHCNRHCGSSPTCLSHCHIELFSPHRASWHMLPLLIHSLISFIGLFIHSFVCSFQQTAIKYKQLNLVALILLTVESLSVA